MAGGISKGKKIANIVGICLASVLIVIAFCGRYFNSGFKYFANFFVGAFGMSFYGFMAGIIVYCSLSLAGKTIKVPKKYVVHFALLFLSVILAVHILTTVYLINGDIDFGQYINYVYNYYGDKLGIPTFGGVVFGIIAYALEAAITIYGAMIVVVALMGWSLYVAGEFFYSYFTGKLSLVKEAPQIDIEPSETTVETVRMTNEEYSRKRAEDILFSEQEMSVYPEYKQQYDVADQSSIDSKPQKDAVKELFFGGSAGSQGAGRSFFEPQVEREKEQKKDDDEFLIRGYRKPDEKTAEDEKPSDWQITTAPAEEVSETEPETEQKPETTVVLREEEPKPVFQPAPDVNSASGQDSEPDITDITMDGETDDDDVSLPFDESLFEEENDGDITQDEMPEPESNTEVADIAEKSVDDGELVPFETETVRDDGNIQTEIKFITKSELEKANSVHKYPKYVAPPVDLLDDVMITEDLEGEDRKRNAENIVNKLAVFGIKVQLADIIVGPSVTRYMFQVLSQKTKMTAFTQYSDDIKACVEAQDDIRIEAPVRGTNMVGIEVANKRKTPVLLRSLLESKEFKEGKGKLVFAIGQEITGKVVVADLADMPHLLIAGATGSGKSVCLNCLIVSLMYKYGPEYVRFLMIDPKYVELSRYNGIPHMLTTETITNVQDAIAGMDYLINEMDARYQLFRQYSVGNISEFNSRVDGKLQQKLPYLVFVVDELADLMSVSKQAFENKLGRLAQKSRACGIHIVLATQRPDRNIITGTIKVNLPCRMALKVSSPFDSATIINGSGAEKLLGKGDMLYMGPGASDLERVQGSYVSNDEIRSLVEFSKESNEIYYDQKISDDIFVSRKAPEEEEEDAKPADKESQLDPYCKKALRFWLEKNNGRASIASIQRSLGIGFNRAGRIMDSLQKLKYVEELSPSDLGSKPLRVLVTLEELDDLFPDMEG